MRLESEFPLFCCNEITLAQSSLPIIPEYVIQSTRYLVYSKWWSCPLLERCLNLGSWLLLYLFHASFQLCQMDFYVLYYTMDGHGAGKIPINFYFKILARRLHYLSLRLMENQTLLTEILLHMEIALLGLGQVRTSIQSFLFLFFILFYFFINEK